MKSKLIAAASVLSVLTSGFIWADEKTEMKKNRDPMTEETARPLPRAESNPAGKPDTTDSKVAKAACAKQTGPAKAACMEDMKDTYGVAPFGSKKLHKSFKDHDTKFGRT